MNSHEILETDRALIDINQIAQTTKIQKKPVLMRINTFFKLENKKQGFSNHVWQKQSINILMWVLRFISIVTKSNFSSSFKLLNKNMFSIIGDKSSNFNFYLIGNYFKYQRPQTLLKFKQFMRKSYLNKLQKNIFIRKIINHNYLLKPESRYLIFWNIYIIVMLNLAVFFVSTRFAFNLDDRPSNYRELRKIFFYLIPQYSFIVDIIIKFNICYYEKGKLVRDRVQICLIYLKTTFIFDFLVIVTQYLYQYNNIEYLDLILVFKLFQMPNLCDNLMDRLELTTHSLAIYDLIKLVYFILTCAHFCSCTFFYIGCLEYDQPTWVMVQKISDADWMTQYGTAFYWSIITMTTIGYGDITPVNIRERTLMIVIALFSCCIFGYAIGNIGEIFGSISKKSNQYRLDINGLKKYLRIKGYSQDLQIQIRRHFEYLWRDEMHALPIDIIKLNQQIPTQLKNEMVIDLNMKSLNNVSFLKETFNQVFIQSLASKFQEERFGPDQVIFQKHQCSNYLYILTEGAFEYYAELPNNKFIPISKISRINEVFGQKEFFTQQAYNISCRSISVSKVLKISREDFVEIAKKHGYEQFCQLRDQIIFGTKNNMLSLICHGCGKSSHQLYQCPMVTGFPNKSKVLLNYRRNVVQERHPKHRKNDLRRTNALQRESEVSDSVLAYIINDRNLLNEVKNNQQFRIPKAKKQTFKSQLSKSKSLYGKGDFFQKENNIQKLEQIRKQISTLNLSFLGTYQIQDETTIIDQQKIQNDIHKTVKYRNTIAIDIANKTTEQTSKDQIEPLSPQNVINEKTPKGKDAKYEFDRITNFNYYMPHNNLEYITIKDKELDSRKSLINFLDVNLMRKSKKKKKAKIFSANL